MSLVSQDESVLYQHFNGFNYLLDNSRTGKKKKKNDRLSQIILAKLFKSSLGMF